MLEEPKPTELQLLFFSNRNKNHLQYMIRKEVLKKIGIAIDNQSDSELRIVMNYIFSEYAKHMDSNLNIQLKDLNEKTIDLSVRNIIPNVTQHLNFLKDREKGYQPLEKPISTKLSEKNLRDKKTIPLPMFI